MLKIKRFFFCCTPFLLTACATGYQDPRPPAQQQAELVETIAHVTGSYEVIDQRGLSGYTNAVVQKYGNGLFITITGPEKRTQRFQGVGCKGWYSVHGVGAVCNRNDSDGSSISIGLSRESSTTVKSLGLIKMFEPMVIPAGDYELDINWYSGHTDHYHLKKKQPPVQ